uniref:Thaumatin-like protein n=1 Tax=Quercus lobata TaxID=97700 RepID=A0A7N2QZW4_QUELO
MKLLDQLVTAFFLFLASHLLLTGSVATNQVTLYVHNKCLFPIWPATAPNTGYPVIADGGFYLPSGQTQRIYVQLTWSGRIWARTGCKFNSNRIPACETGDCDRKLACYGLIGKPPVTLVQIALQEDQSKSSFYDVSLVDGYNIPVSVTIRQTPELCIIRGCLQNVNDFCPQELEVLNENGEVVACKSACAWLLMLTIFVVGMSLGPQKSASLPSTQKSLRMLVLLTIAMFLTHPHHW